MIISLWSFLGIEIFHTKLVEKIKTHILYSLIFSETHTIYEIMWSNMVERGRPPKTIWRMRIACYITKARDTHSEWEIFIASPRQKLLRERVSLLRLYVYCLSSFTNENHSRYEALFHFQESSLLIIFPSLYIFTRSVYIFNRQTHSALV
jgi:hypothetical protein